MRKAIKYISITIGGIVFLFAAVLLIAPYLISVDQFKPKIEQIITEKSGYPLTIQGDIALSVFPWVGLSLSDLKLDNPEGFQEKSFLTIKHFQARIKILPLLTKKVEIHRFIIDQPHILLTRSDSGVWNWQSHDQLENKEMMPGRQGSSAAEDGTQTVPEDNVPRQLGIESLLVGECALRDGSVTVTDLLNKTSRKLSDINLTLQDVSLDKPVILTLLAKLDGKPVEVTGHVGPVTDDPLTNKIDFNLDVELFNTLSFNGAGHVEKLASAPSYLLAFHIPSFSPRQLFADLNLNFPLTASGPGPQPLESIEAQGSLSGTRANIALSQAKIAFDETNLLAELNAKDFSRPDLEFHLEMDSIDIDRYLPAGHQKSSEAAREAAKQSPPESETEKPNGSAAPSIAEKKGKSTGGEAPEAAVAAPDVNFEPLRKIVLKGDISIETIRVHGGTISNLTASVNGNNGLFTLTSLKSSLYQGTISSTGHADFRKTVPVSDIDLDIEGVQAGPLLKDFADKDIIEGTLKATIGLGGSGMTADQLKATLSGSGELLFQDGALIGVDLAQLARKIKSGFTLEEQGERPKTDFAEFNAPFTITSGLFETKNTTLKSPFIRVNGQGTADLVSEKIDFRLTPKLVGTMIGQGDQENRSGIAVPIIVGGTFNKPTFAPDLKALVQQQGIKEEEVTEILKTGKITPERKEQLGEEVEKAKSLLKGLFGN